MDKTTTIKTTETGEEYAEVLKTNIQRISKEELLRHKAILETQLLFIDDTLNKFTA